MTHALKTWPEYFKDIESGKKNFELRKFDRPYQVGDRLLLQEFNSVDNGYTGKELEFRISYLLHNCPEFGLKKGFCILGLEKIADY